MVPLYFNNDTIIIIIAAVMVVRVVQLEGTLAIEVRVCTGSRSRRNVLLS